MQSLSHLFYEKINNKLKENKNISFFKNIKDIKLISNELDKFKVNFGRVNINIKSIDWLYLLYSGHRRAKFTYNEGIEMSWLAP